MVIWRASSGSSALLALDVLVQVDAVDELHRQVAGAAALVELVDGDDVLVAELGGVAGLAAETLQGVGLRRHVRRQDLQGHLALEHGVDGLVDRPHAAGGDVRHHLVLADANGTARRLADGSGGMRTPGQSGPRGVRGHERVELGIINGEWRRGQ